MVLTDNKCLWRKRTKVTGANGHQNLSVVAGSAGIWRGKQRTREKQESLGARTHIKLQESTYMLISPPLWISKDFLRSRSHVHEQKTWMLRDHQPLRSKRQLLSFTIGRGGPAKLWDAGQFHPRQFKAQMKVPPRQPFRVSTVTPHQSLWVRAFKDSC